MGVHGERRRQAGEPVGASDGPFRVAHVGEGPRVASDECPGTGDAVIPVDADDALGLLYRISRVMSQQGCDVDLVLISTEGHKAIDVFHITQAGAKLSAAAQDALAAGLQRLLEEDHEVD